MRTIGRLEPDAVLLDGFAPAGYGDSWDLAAGIRNRTRPVPVVMFTAHARDVAEAEEATSDRSERAGFAAILSKPFSLDELVETVARAGGHSEPFDHSRGAEEVSDAGACPGAEGPRRHGREAVQCASGPCFAIRTVRGASCTGGRVAACISWADTRRAASCVMIGQFIDREAALELALPS